MLARERLNFVFYLIAIFVSGLCHQVQSANNINKAYLIENEKFLTWHASVEYCKNMSMSLLKVENLDEFEYLKSIIKSKYGRVLPYWLDAYKIDGVFKWASTGEDIKLFLWHAGEPNDRSGSEKCIHTWEESFDWNDNDCKRELPLICELHE